MPSSFGRLFKPKKTDGRRQAAGKDVVAPQGTLDEAEEVCGLFDFENDPPSEALFDVIAVHGLGGHWRGTWTAEGDKLWLRDFLPAQLKTLGITARIRSYGYNSNVAFSKAVTDLSNEAEMLLDRIRGERVTDEEKCRPILFVAYSLGGILVKKAMIIAHERSAIYSNVLKNIYGVAFLGTPHRGSDLAWWANFPATLVKSLQLGRGTNKAYVEALKRNSEEFSDISRQWVERAMELRIRTYYETERLLGFLVVDEDSARLNLPNEIPTGIAGANHKTICKFEKENSQKYKQIWNGTREMAVGIQKMKTETTKGASIKFKLTDEHVRFLHKLCEFAGDYESDRNRNPKRERGTCEWITSHESYKTWVSDDKSHILWISGDPGCGKSVAASFLVDYLRDSTEYEPAYFFFKDDSERQSSDTVVLNALLHQILRINQNEPLLDHAMPVYTSCGDELFKRFDNLWSVFSKIVSDPLCRNMAVVLDALDECTKQSRDRLMAKIAALFTCTEGGQNRIPTRVKFLLTSRPYAEVERSFKNFRMIRLKTEGSVEHIENDVKLIIDARIQLFADRLEVSEPPQLESLRKNLHSKADQTFLWVSLILDILDNNIEVCTYEELADIVNSSNPGLDALYEKILQKTKDPKKTQRMLHFVVGAQEPLTVEEINIAWAIEEGKKGDLESRKFPSPERSIREICGLFVRIVNSRVVLVHQTAKEFLVQESASTREESVPWRWKHCLSPLETNRVLAEVCLTFLLFHFLEVARYQPGPAFQSHSCDNVFHYISGSNPKNNALLRQLTLQLFDDINKRPQQILRFRNNNQSSIFHAVDLDFEWLVHDLFQAGHEVNGRPRDGRTPLLHAVERGNLAMVKLLLDSKADIEKRYPLHFAAENGFILGVKLLLERGANPMAVYPPWTSEIPLHRAKNAAVVDMLVDYGGPRCLESQDKYGNTPLLCAAEDNRSEAAGALLGRGANPAAKKRWDGKTSLHLSSDAATVEALLESGMVAFLEIKESWNRRTPLLEAAELGRVEVARTLLRYGADIKAKNRSGHTALHLAANDAMRKLLVESGGRQRDWK